jgi:hypothetical protein
MGAHMDIVAHKRKHRDEFVGRVDDGRKLLSVSMLSAAGAVLTISLIGLISAMFFGARTSLSIDIAAASIGATICFLYLARISGLFRHRGDDKS